MPVWPTKDFIQFPLADHLAQPWTLYWLSMKQVFVVAEATNTEKQSELLSLYSVVYSKIYLYVYILYIKMYL